MFYLKQSEGLSNSAFLASHASVSFTTWHRPYMMLIEVCD